MRTLPDIRAPATVALRALLADRSEPYALDALVGTELPASATPEERHLPYVLVATDDTTAWAWPAAARGLVRLTAWASTEDDAHDLAVLAQALLADHHDQVIRSMRPTGGLVHGRDPDTDIPVCSALLRATCHTTVI
ncbi:hypothetical protein AB0I72_00485 [Nocardiopsis sp. NPDC049922]|uniref:hypothetical protein n=1 Tax=Nocardiopsis sp. NPDC049922 TaxID=3155157 RepID=UPI0033F3CD6C